MIKAYSYARFSSRAQAEGDSLRRQLAAAFAYAEAHGLELDTSLQDKGVSAFTGDNRTKGALRSFLDRVEAGEVERGSFLLIDSMDRLSRQMVVEATHQLLGIALAGVTVVTINDGRRFDRDASMADMILAVAEIERSHRESAEKSRKVREAHQNSKRRAREGRIWHSKGPTWLTRAGDRWEPVADKVRIVRKAFDLREAGMGTTAIAIRLNEDGDATPTGRGTWHHSAVLEVLKNRAVLGEYQPKSAPGGSRGSRRPPDGDPIPNYYLPIIAEDQFNRVQGLIAATYPKAGRRPNAVQVSNLFAGIVKCRECGGSFGYHGGGGKGRKAALRCYDASRRQCENRRRYSYERVEATILKHVRDFDLTPPARNDDAAPTALDKAIVRCSDLERVIGVLLDQFETDQDDLIRARLDKRRAEWATARAEIAKLQRNVSIEQARLAPGVRMQQIADLQADLASKEGRELYDLRIRLAQAIRDVVTRIDFGSDGHFYVYVLDGFSNYVFRDFEFLFGHQGTPELLESPRYGKRFTRGDPAREAKARRVLRNLAAAE